MKSKLNIILSFMLIGFVFVLYSCGTSPSNFYLLTPANGCDQQVNNNEIGVGIGSLELPDYMMKPQILRYTSQNEIKFDEFNRWAEPLDENFTRVMIENLSQMIPTNSIYLFMWPEEEKSIYQVNVNVDQFGLMPDSSVVLYTRWSVSAKNIKSYWLSEKSDYTQKVTKIDYNEISSAMSDLVKDLCEDIAEEIKRKAKK